MKLIDKLCPVILLACTCSLGAEDNSIVTFTLNERTIYRVPVSQNRVTTIRFPGPLQAIEAAGVTTNAQTPGFFHISYRPPNHFFSVRALVQGASANVNVVWKDTTYVVELVQSDKPALSVIFVAPPSPTVAPFAAASGETPRLSDGQLLGLLQRAKAYPLLLKHHPQAVAGITCVRPNLVSEYDTFILRTDEIFRSDACDALVFRVMLSSKTGREIRYKPASFAVRVGDHAYHQAISDADGIIPAQGEVPAYFAIVGTAGGQRNDLSPDNRYLVLVTPLPTQEPMP